jgi:ABC-2 type transport system permease protein
MSSLALSFSDTMVLAKRNLARIPRQPDLLIAYTIQPVMFVLLFAYVLGSGIEIPGVPYREYLMGGIFVQTVVFGSAMTGVGLAEDLQKGIIDRFRSLPMARSAVLVGRTTSDVVNNAAVVVVMGLTGLAVGWRVRTSWWEALAGFGLLLLFAYAMSWVSATIGLSVRSVEVANSAGFIWLFPLTFLSNAFVATAGLPSWLRPVADWNPVSSVIQAVRQLFGNTSPLLPPGDAWPLQHPVLATLAWSAIILAVFGPLSVSRYRAAASR